MSDTDKAANQQDSNDRELTRQRLAWESVLVGVVSSGLTSTLYTIMWDHSERATGSLQTYGRVPLHDLVGILVFMPLGFIIYTPVPPGWLFWSGFAVALHSRHRAGYLLCALGGLLFGLWWPKQFVGLMDI